MKQKFAVLLTASYSDMQFISFYIIYALIWLFSLLPMRVLYFLTDFVFLLIYYVIPYRKRLVYKNLRSSFPEWDEKQYKETAKEFYHFLCEFFMESTIFIFMSEKEVLRRYRYKNPELLDQIYSQGKSVIIVMGHYGNWEWAVSLQKYIKHLTLPVYKSLNNKYFDRMFIRSRQRFGSQAVTIEKILRVLSDCHNRGILNLSYFAADQRPLMKNIHYWTDFMNQETPVVLGPEKLAKKFDSAVVFLKTKRIKQGFYETEFILITDDPLKTKDKEITQKFLQNMERQIIEEPAYWLWTHDRWKHKKADYDRIYGRKEQHS